MAQISTVTKKQRTALNSEIIKGHHIPNVLISKILKLQNVRYRNELQHFATEYKKARFRDIADEYDLVKDLINTLFGTYLSPAISRIIEREMRASLAGQALDTAVRETFIHPFQVFLVGTIVIDRYYDQFRNWYGDALNLNPASSIEASWLLAAILHDGAKPRNTMRKELERTFGNVVVQIPNENEYVRLIGSFYRFRSAGNDANNWTAQAPNDINLEAIMNDSSSRWSHGVKGAVIMMSNVCGSPTAVTQRDVIAGFSIVFHDKDVWVPMQTGHYFPLRMDLFPLACLLLQLDAAQEWGRNRIVDTETKLVGITIRGRIVTIEVAFESIKALQKKDSECDSAVECVDSSHLQIALDLRIRKKLSA